MPSALIGAAVVFLAVVLVTRYVSLASIIAAATIPLFVFIQGLLEPFLGMIPMLATALLGAALIILAHHANIKRLLSGPKASFDNNNESRRRNRSRNLGHDAGKLWRHAPDTKCVSGLEMLTSRPPSTTTA
jgi:glycerol-3-phosphate acyltransferase PlsY